MNSKGKVDLTIPSSRAAVTAAAVMRPLHCVSPAVGVDLLLFQCECFGETEALSTTSFGFYDGKFSCVAGVACERAVKRGFSSSLISPRTFFPSGAKNRLTLLWGKQRPDRASLAHESTLAS